MVITIKLPKRKRRYWTPSCLKDFEECPAKYARKQELKLSKWEQSKAAARGDKIHKVLEHRLLKVPTTIHLAPADQEKLSKWDKEVKKLIRAKAVPEQMWWIDREWKATKPDYDENLWARMKTDVHVPTNSKQLTIVDYKTGQVYDSHDDTMEIYAVAGAARFPTVPKVTVELWYIDQRDVNAKTYNKKELAELREDWSRRAQKALDAEEFPETPSANACFFCDFKKEKGGQCTSR